MPSARSMTAGSVVQGANVLKEAVNRLVGTPGLVAALLGLLPFKQLRLRVVILRDEQGKPLCHPEDVCTSIEEANRIFTEAAHVRVVAAAPLVMTVLEPAPTLALDVHCDDGAWQEDFDVAGAYFRRHMANSPIGKWTGYATPVTVFIVRDISKKGGCSLGPLTDYVTVEAKMLNRAAHRLLAHEVAHACGLWHSKHKANLMFPKGPGERMARWQAAILRNSRHVTLL